MRHSPPCDVGLCYTQQVQRSHVELEKTAAVETSQSQQLESTCCPWRHARHSVFNIHHQTAQHPTKYTHLSHSHPSRL